MRVLSILQDASFEGAAQAKKTAEEEEVGRVNTDAVLEFACRFIVMNIFARMDRRDLHRAFAVSSARFRAWRSGFPCGCALSESLAGRGPAQPSQPFDSAYERELKLIVSGNHRSTQCTRIDLEENSNFRPRSPSNTNSEN
jgi:hypothetical protein